LGYFPKLLQERFGAELLTHPLAKHIKATVIVNELLDEVGITFVHRTATALNRPAIEVICAWFAAHLLTKASAIKAGLLPLENVTQTAAFYGARKEISDGLRAITEWLLTLHQGCCSPEGIVAEKSQIWSQLLSSGYSTLPAEDVAAAKLREGEFLALGLSSEVVNQLALLPWINSLLEIAELVVNCGGTFASVSKAYRTVNQELRTIGVIRAATALTPHSKWERELTAAAIQELRSALSSLTKKLLSQLGKEASETQFAAAVRALPGVERIKVAAEEMKVGNIDCAGIALLARKMTGLGLIE
jgi:glutamate dehydrogenase